MALTRLFQHLINLFITPITTNNGRVSSSSHFKALAQFKPMSGSRLLAPGAWRFVHPHRQLGIRSHSLYSRPLHHTGIASMLYHASHVLFCPLSRRREEGRETEVGEVF